LVVWKLRPAAPGEEAFFGLVPEFEEVRDEGSRETNIFSILEYL
jgi:hypothetical protein